MATKIYSNEMASHSLRHRAVCNDCNYKGPWRENINDAYQDANQHMAVNPNHSMEIITEQTLRMKFSG